MRLALTFSPLFSTTLAQINWLKVKTKMTVTQSQWVQVWLSQPLSVTQSVTEWLTSDSLTLSDWLSDTRDVSEWLIIDGKSHPITELSSTYWSSTVQ